MDNNGNINQTNNVYNSYHGSTVVNMNTEVIDEERRKYLLEKEEKIRKTKKRKKIVSTIVGSVVLVFVVFVATSVFSVLFLVATFFVVDFLF